MAYYADAEAKSESKMAAGIKTNKEKVRTTCYAGMTLPGGMVILSIILWDWWLPLFQPHSIGRVCRPNCQAVPAPRDVDCKS